MLLVTTNKPTINIATVLNGSGELNAPFITMIPNNTKNIPRKVTPTQ
ncbi:MAG: hypothetical protein WC010_03565 [Candidatus Absconditabacterales bacterium]